MDRRIVEALLSDDMLKTAEDAEAAGRIVARAFTQEWQRLDGLFKGANSEEKEEAEDEEEDDEDEAEEPKDKGDEAEKAEESEKKGSDEEGEEDEGPVSPEDLAWLVENLGI